jgi:hypothetical protein
MRESVAIIGSREWPDPSAVSDYVLSLDKTVLVVSGGAKGVDTWAQIAAEERGMGTLIFKPDYNTHGKTAPLLRNKDIIDNADRVVAFWDGTSHGTKNAIDYARQCGKSVLIFKPPGRS